MFAPQGQGTEDGARSAVVNWLEKAGTDAIHIAPSKSWLNSLGESSNNRLRYECPNWHECLGLKHIHGC